MLTSGVGDKIRESVGLETSENDNESEGDNRAIDFKSCGVGDIVAFGGFNTISRKLHR